jgi:hypothetical protein
MAEQSPGMRVRHRPHIVSVRSPEVLTGSPFRGEMEKPLREGGRCLEGRDLSACGGLPLRACGAWAGAGVEQAEHVVAEPFGRVGIASVHERE